MKFIIRYRKVAVNELILEADSSKDALSKFNDLIAAGKPSGLMIGLFYEITQIQRTNNEIEKIIKPNSHRTPRRPKRQKSEAPNQRSRKRSSNL